MPAKPFCSIPEQLEILSRRGLRVSASDGDILLGENYYAVINGYKAPFIDRIASSSSPEERYIGGASFSDIYALYRFDAKLRELMLGYLLRCEARVKSVSAHTFCEHHPEPAAYLDMENYTTRQDYMPGQKAFVADLPRFIEELRYKAVAQRQCKPYIQHYRERYSEVPLWVLINELTFGNVSYFFNLLPRTEQNQIRKRIVRLQHRAEKSILTPQRGDCQRIEETSGSLARKLRQAAPRRPCRPPCSTPVKAFRAQAAPKASMPYRAADSLFHSRCRRH